MLEEAAGVEGRELSLGERQAQLEKYRFRFVNIYQELEMSSRFVDTHRDVSQGGDGVQLHSHTFYEMIYCTGGSTQYLLGTQRYRLRHGDIVLIPPGVSHRPLLAEKMADPYRRCVVWFSQEYVESVRPMWPELLKNQRFGVLRTANTRWEGMAKLFEAGCGEAARGAPGWQAVVCATTLELLVNIARALDEARDAGFLIYGAAFGEGSLDAFTTRLHTPALLVLGNEEHGIRPQVAKRCHHLLHIPMLRTFDSLNVAQAGGILTSCFARQHLEKNPSGE